MRERISRYEGVFAGLLVLFTTFVVLTNTVGVKLFELDLGFYSAVLPVSILWYPLTFLITDIISEVYGKNRATFFVITGFAMSVVLLLFSLAGLALPPADFYNAEPSYQQIS